MQKFIASVPSHHANGAIGWAPGGAFDPIGPYAKVQNCPIEGTSLRRTAYASGMPDTFFSVPACTRVKGRYIGGFFTSDESGVTFRPYDRYRPLLQTLAA